MHKGYSASDSAALLLQNKRGKNNKTTAYLKLQKTNSSPEYMK